VKGLTIGGVAAGLGLWRESASAQTPSPPQAGAAVAGTEFDLRIGESLVNFTGAPRIANTVNGSLPAPTLRWKEGNTVTLRVTNTLQAEPASIHWHGIALPANMDGVPGLSFHGIAPGETYTYRFHVRQAGTYWYHSHSAFQEQLGLYGPLVIEPHEPEPFHYDREHVVMLSDWTDEHPARVFAKLKKQSDYYNYRRRTVVDFLADVRHRGLSSTLADRSAWGRMRMSASDLADVSGATYTYLMNGVSPAGNWTGLIRAGERVRLRVINGSAMTHFDVRVPGLKMTVVAADGQYVHPVTVDEFRLAVAETLDVIVEPSGQEAFTIFAQSLDRTGYALGTLAVRRSSGSGSGSGSQAASHHGGHGPRARGPLEARKHAREPRCRHTLRAGPARRPDDAPGAGEPRSARGPHDAARAAGSARSAWRARSPRRSRPGSRQHAVAPRQ